MNYPFRIAARLSSSKHKSFSKLIIRIAVAGAALSIAVMIISLSIVTGFQQQIRDKIIGFGSHIQIAHVDLNNSYETAPIYSRQAYLQNIRHLPDVVHIQTFATKAGLIKTGTDIEATVMKGVGNDFNWDFFNRSLNRGHIFKSNNKEPVDQVLISQYTADKLRLDTGQKLTVYFIQEPVRVRRFTICGIYETGLEEFDKIYMLCDMGHIQKLNNWDHDMVGGFEIQLSSFDHLDTNTTIINNMIGYQYEASSVKKLNPNLFEWLGLLDVNVEVISFLMLLVSTINMITAILILILERTQMIGLMKAMGATNEGVRQIFVFLAARFILRGLFWGNLIGISFCLLQAQFGLFKLDQATYYMSQVPIHLNFFHVLLLNCGAFVVCFLCMFLPVQFINRINPIKVIRFE